MGYGLVVRALARRGVPVNAVVPRMGDRALLALGADTGKTLPGADGAGRGAGAMRDLQW